MRRRAICLWLPAPASNGKTRLFSAEVDAPLLCLFGDLIEDYTVRHASKIVERFKRAILKHPKAPQLALVKLANGSTFAQPTTDLDLASGFVSGQYLRSAMIVDLRNYRERVQREIAAAPMVIGGDDD